MVVIVYINDLGLNFILRLSPVSYNYKDDNNKRRRDGLIAQDVQKILNELGLGFRGLIIDNDTAQTMNLSYDTFVIPLINAIQEQQKLIGEQGQSIKQLQTEIQELRSKNQN